MVARALCARRSRLAHATGGTRCLGGSIASGLVPTLATLPSTQSSQSSRALSRTSVLPQTQRSPVLLNALYQLTYVPSFTLEPRACLRPLEHRLLERLDAGPTTALARASQVLIFRVAGSEAAERDVEATLNKALEKQVLIVPTRAADGIEVIVLGGRLFVPSACFSKAVRTIGGSLEGPFAFTRSLTIARHHRRGDFTIVEASISSMKFLARLSETSFLQGIHNIFVVIPQFLVTGLTALLFAILEPQRSDDFSDAGFTSADGAIEDITTIQIDSTNLQRGLLRTERSTRHRSPSLIHNQDPSVTGVSSLTGPTTDNMTHSRLLSRGGEQVFGITTIKYISTSSRRW
ncbi:hypothetical protein BGY98DRAFT_1103946 [Russula aff. rugulosa BPL654]|nr:hypothetical protein BGY98DRAFT_1103946 [Russula aff. rugulosa BPL654]